MNKSPTHSMAQRFIFNKFRFLTKDFSLWKWAILWFCFFIPTQSRAEWTQISQSKDGKLYIDKDTIKNYGGMMRMWDLWDYAEVQIQNDFVVWSSSSLFEYDCINFKTRMISGYGYLQNMGKGRAAYQRPETSRWFTVPSQSVRWTMLKVACGQ